MKNLSRLSMETFLAGSVECTGGAREGQRI
jgi:hypothetical protein